MSRTLQMLGRLAAAMSLFFLAQGVFKFGLSYLFQQLLQFYHHFFYPLAEIFRPIGEYLVREFDWRLPSWWREAVLLYVSIGLTGMRVFSGRQIFYKRAPGSTVEARREGGRIRKILWTPLDEKGTRGGRDLLSVPEILVGVFVYSVFWPISVAVDIAVYIRRKLEVIRVRQKKKAGDTFPHAAELRLMMYQNGYGWLGNSFRLTVKEYALVLLGAAIFIVLNAGL